MLRKFVTGKNVVGTTDTDILTHLRDSAALGKGAVLVTLVSVEGSSSRGVGAQMAVRGCGAYIGSFSGGCIEAAVVAEALEVLAAREGRMVRFGVGSPYIDVRLPCGGGIDLLFTPNPDADLIDAALASLKMRRGFQLVLTPDRVLSSVNPPTEDHFSKHLFPRLRILAFGQGDDLSAFAQLAQAYCGDIKAFATAKETVGQLASAGIPAQLLASQGQCPDEAGDAWTAIVLLFHDHDWETALLPTLLDCPAFFHGAVGSPRTHAARLVALRGQNVPEASLTRLRGPIGLIPSTRDPRLLGLSILAEVAAAYDAACHG